MCLYPKLIQNRKYVSNKKNGGNVPVPSDGRVLAVAIGCGRCMECMKKKAREWQVRLLEDVRHNKNGKFVTLTFSDESIAELSKDIEDKRGYELDNAIATLATRRFVERWRKEHKKSVRHWLVTELGHNGTENIHMHGIVWTDKEAEEIKKHWKYGFVWIGEYVSERTVNYITKYVHKMDNDHKEYKAKILTSSGIGRGYMEREDAKGNRYVEGETKETYRTRTGDKMAMPIYWRNKLYSEEEREKLWLEKLDKQERWVGKIKVDISKGEEKYYKLLKEAQEKAVRLGYQTNETDWSRKKYEEERRNLLTKKRIDRADLLNNEVEKMKEDPDEVVERSLRGRGFAPPSAESVNGAGLRPSLDW